MDRFKGKKIAIVGLSTEGQDAIRFFLKQRCDIICLDRRDETILFSSYPDMKNLPVRFHLGDSYLSELSAVDIIVRTPGMSLKTPELIQARARGVEITSVTKLFLELCKAPIIGVTGTKGKGTTSTLIYEMLKKSGKTAYLGGNVGTPLLSLVESIKPEDWVVLELSSFQLEDLNQSPHIAVVLKVTQEHLANFDPLATNFHASREAYVEAKKHIISHQKTGDFAVFHADDPTSCSFAKYTEATPFFYGKSPNAQALIENDAVFLMNDEGKHGIVDRSHMKLLGSHNLENVAAASLASSLVGITLDDIKSTAEAFPGLPLRLEKVGVKNGVLYINDSFSTTPESTISAIDAFDAPIILILGGSEKGADFTLMGEAIAHSNVKKTIVVGQMTERIVQSLHTGGFQGEMITGLTSMHDMVTKAAQGSQPGDVILLSPACASFDLFKNYKERGKQFTYEVSLL